MPGLDAERRLQTVCLLVLTTFAIAGALYWLSTVMIPFVLAVFLSFAINPVVGLLTRKARLPRSIAILVVFLLGFLLLPLIGALVSSSARQLTDNADAYQTQIGELARGVVDLLPLDRFEAVEEQTRQQLASLPIGSILARLANSLVAILSNAVLVLIFVVFLVIGAGSAERQGVWAEIEERIERYLVAKFTISAATGGLVGAILYSLGVDLALLFGFLAFLLNFIPSIGSIVSTLLPLPILLVSPDVSATTVVLALLLPGSVQFVVGNVVEPKVMGDSLDLHPIAILLALIFWGVLWGVIGMLLATPITAVLRILLEQNELTRPVAHVMAGRFGSRSEP